MEFLIGAVLIVVVGALMGGLVAAPFLLIAWLLKPRPPSPVRLLPPRDTGWTDDDEIAARYHH